MGEAERERHVRIDHADYSHYTGVHSEFDVEQASAQALLLQLLSSIEYLR